MVVLICHRWNKVVTCLRTFLSFGWLRYFLDGFWISPHRMLVFHSLHSFLELWPVNSCFICHFLRVGIFPTTVVYSNAGATLVEISSKSSNTTNFQIFTPQTIFLLVGVGLMVFVPSMLSSRFLDTNTKQRAAQSPKREWHLIKCFGYYMFWVLLDIGCCWWWQSCLV